MKRCIQLCARQRQSIIDVSLPQSPGFVWQPSGNQKRLFGSSRPLHLSSSHSDDSAGVQVTRTSPSSSPTYQQENVDAKLLVDGLLERTRSLMDGSDYHIIAYSGGVDSALVAALVHNSATSQESVRAVLGLSPAVPSDQVTLAEHVAQVIGVTLEQIPTTEGTDATYIENSGQACLACKTHLYSCLDAIVEHAGNRRLYNGTNADDVQDPTRLGLIAADKFEVQSPLRYTVKENVRAAAKYLGLPNWNYAASPCLRSRLAFGVEAIPEHLQRIDKAERQVRQFLGLNSTHNLRVRLLAQNRAMIEVEAQHLEGAQTLLDTWQTIFQEELGFASVGVRSFKSGSVAEVVEPKKDYAMPKRDQVEAYV
jgi:uncharacterized protein